MQSCWGSWRTVSSSELQPDLRQNILAYYKDLNPSVPVNSTKKEKAERTKLLDQLNRLKGVPDPVTASSVP
jgi:hypothetical protein